MAHEPPATQGTNINDPESHPADRADHAERIREHRDDASHTGGQHDDQGHTPKVPGTPDAD